MAMALKQLGKMAATGLEGAGAAVGVGLKSGVQVAGAGVMLGAGVINLGAKGISHFGTGIGKGFKAGIGGTIDEIKNMKPKSLENGQYTMQFNNAGKVKKKFSQEIMSGANPASSVDESIGNFNKQMSFDFDSGGGLSGYTEDVVADVISKTEVGEKSGFFGSIKDKASEHPFIAAGIAAGGLYAGSQFFDDDDQ